MTRRGGAPDPAALAALDAPLEKAPQVDPITGKSTTPTAKKVKVAFWVTEAEADRIRATVDATRRQTGLRGLSEFIAHATLEQVGKLEGEHNRGEPWEPLPSGSLPVGRPMRG